MRDGIDPSRLPAATESLRHLLAELKRIDALIQAEVHRAREHHKSEDPSQDLKFNGLCISDSEIDALLAAEPCAPRFPCWETCPENGSSLPALSSPSRLAELARRLELSPFDVDCLLICLAPELDPRYEHLYAYLQDDVTRRRPSVDLVLDLLCRTTGSKLAGRRHFAPQAALLRKRVLQLFEDPSQPHPTLLGRYLKADERIVNYLLESDELDARLMGYLAPVESKTELDNLVLAAETKRRLASFTGGSASQCLILYIQGPYGSGKQAIAEALCRKLSLNLLLLDGKRLAGNTEADFQVLVEVAAREAVLQSAALYISSFEALLHDEKAPLLNVLLKEIDGRRPISFLAGETAWEPANELRRGRFLRLELGRPAFAERLQLWQQAIEQKGEIDLSALSTKFRFTPGQIRDAAATARNLAYGRDEASGDFTMADLYEACRLQCNRKLSSLARKIKPHYAWDDIILPLDRVQQLREICNALKYRALVYDQWGFERKLSLGKGLNILFSGPPGTGKTMAAEIMAGELGLDLYKTDLSSLVSKYIGETEKNLSRIFAEAETSNAILFFDEADALFGKRSEVRDSHDRYANIEINYLLQKMEEHEGVVILATNFRKNMDDAFVRRLHFTIDFPLPDENDRRRIWEAIWPTDTPRHVDLDLQAIARRFELPGGHIRNIAIGAAFLAADDGGVVNMQHLLHATRREYQKMGKVVMHGEFEKDEEIFR